MKDIETHLNNFVTKPTLHCKHNINNNITYGVACMHF